MQTVARIIMTLFNPIANPVPALRIQRNRQVLVVLWAVTTLASVLLVSRITARPILVSAIIAFLIALVLTVATRNIPTSVNANTDEWEQKLRDHVHRIAYWTVIFVIGAIMGSLFAFNDQPELIARWMTQLGFEKRFALLTVSAAFFGGLPTALFAWLEPDPILED
jgi:hypothetical protein